MTHNRKGSKRSGIRYDRLLILLLALALVITLLILLIKGIANAFSDDDKAPDSSLKNNPSTQTTEETKPSAPAEYKAVTYKYSDIQKGNLILVNPAQEYMFPAEAESENIVVLDNKTQSYTVGDNITKMNRGALKRFNEMMDAFCSEKGISSIRLVTAYRTKEAQDKRAESNGEPKGGFSEHNTGLCVDIGVYDAKSEGYYKPEGDYAWINDNCDKYGFILRYSAAKESYTSNKGEEYHFRYVGTPHAYYMKKNNLCLEEYISLLSNDYKYEKAKLQITCYNKEYEVYYFTAAFEGDTTVYIPSDKESTVSGDNFGGFIVTVEK